MHMCVAHMSPSKYKLPGYHGFVEVKKNLWLLLKFPQAAPLVSVEITGNYSDLWK